MYCVFIAYLKVKYMTTAQKMKGRNLEYTVMKNFNYCEVLLNYLMHKF